MIISLIFIINNVNDNIDNNSNNIDDTIDNIIIIIISEPLKADNVVKLIKAVKKASSRSRRVPALGRRCPRSAEVLAKDARRSFLIRSFLIRPAEALKP